MGARHTHGWRDYTQLFAERVRCDLRRHRDLILNAAVDGSTSLDCLADLDRVLGAYRPDVAMLMIGTNDSAMDRRISPERCKNALRAIVAKLREVGAHVVLQTPNPIISSLASPYRRKFGAMVRTIRETAVLEKLPLIDHFMNWERLFRGSSAPSATHYMCDGIHPNAFGHALLAHHLFGSLGICDAGASRPLGPFLSHPKPRKTTQNHKTKMKTKMKTKLAAVLLSWLASFATPYAATLASYDAAAAGAGVTPTAVSPAWTFSGGGYPQMVNNGTFLLQSGSPGTYGEYTSPSAGVGTMVFRTSTYGIGFRVRPLTDVAFVGADWSNLYVAWADNSWFYNVTIDKYAGGTSSGTGDIVYGRNSFSPAITGIDWSVTHDIYIGVRGTAGANGEFDFYLDGVLQSTVGGGSIARDRAGWAFLEDKVNFGDGTTGGTDVQAEWYSIGIYDSATPVPEPSHLALWGFAAVGLALGYRKLRKARGQATSRSEPSLE